MVVDPQGFEQNEFFNNYKGSITERQYATIKFLTNRYPNAMGALNVRYNVRSWEDVQRLSIREASNIIKYMVEMGKAQPV